MEALHLQEFIGGGYIYNFFSVHSLLSSLVFLAVAWFPAIVGYAPGLFMGSSPTQVLMWFGLPNSTAEMVRLIDPNVTLTAHHPVLHTAIFGGCIQLGLMLGSAEVGYLLYTSLQLVLTLLTIAYSITLLSRLGVPLFVRALVLAIIALVPWYAGYAVLATYGALFSDGVLLMCLELVIIAKQGGRRRDWIILLFGAIVVSLMRSGGILLASVGLLTAIILDLKQDRWRQFLNATGVLIVVLLAFFSFTQGLQPALHITPGSKVEMLSIPFQQTARYIKEHPGDASQEEIDAIDAVLAYEGLAERYNPILSDPVKGYAAAHRKDFNAADLARYLKAWASMGLRDPACYALATMNNYYGYLYFSEKPVPYYNYTGSVSRMQALERGSSIRIQPFNQCFVKALASFNTVYAEFFRRMPIFSLTMSSAFWCWMLIIVTAYCGTRHVSSMAAPLAILFMIMLMFFAGPCNGATYNRYTFPIAFALPFIFSTLAGKIARGR